MAKRRLSIVLEQGLGAVRLHRTRAADAFLLRTGLDETTCRMGCTHCCHYPVRISILEGIVLYRALQSKNLWDSNLKHALEKHSKRTFEVAPEVWLLAGIACPLLSEGQCTAYDARPFTCRMTLSTRDPDLCRSVYFNSGTFVEHRDESVAFEHVLRSASKNAQSRLLQEAVPISTAILLGRHVVECGVESEDLDRSLLNEITSGVVQ